MNPLAQLRDIHAAPTPDWWPPAPGWWLLALILAVLLFYIVRGAMRWLRRWRRRRAIIAEFTQTLSRYDEHGDRRRLAMELDLLLRRLALLRWGADSAGATGEQWLRLWSAAADDPMARLLLTAPYQARPDYDVASLHNWVLARVRDHA
ncbi:MAG: hypothetical protein Tsb002_15770 [Wenzhouxiangellaceae bacterium]